MANVKSYIDSLLTALTPANAAAVIAPDTTDVGVICESPLMVAINHIKKDTHGEEDEWVDLSKGSPPTQHSDDTYKPRQRDSGVDVDEMQPPSKHPHIPRFYTPRTPPSQQMLKVRLTRIRSLFPPDGLSLSEFTKVTKACRLPTYFNAALFRACLGFEEGDEGNWGDVSEGCVRWEDFERTWMNLHTRTRIKTQLNPLTTLTFSILDIHNKSYLVASDLDIIIQDILKTHPSFAFLSPTSPFHALYARTVTTRLLYDSSLHVGRGRMTIREYAGLGLVEMVDKVETVEGCLSVEMPDPFSYRDFYIIYCQFYDLDSDKDMLLSLKDFAPYTEDTLSQTALKRMMEVYGRPAPPESALPKPKRKGMKRERIEGKVFEFEEFVVFHKSLTSPTTPQSLTYFFTFLDADSDGVLRAIELEPFYRSRTSTPCTCTSQSSFTSFLRMTYDLLKLDGGLDCTDQGLRLTDLKRNPADGAAFLNGVLGVRKG
ncbi:hypothetical protein HK097_000954, partial [Rhizophlyctis rosea]